MLNVTVPCGTLFQVNWALIWLGTAEQKSLSSVATITGCTLSVRALYEKLIGDCPAWDKKEGRVSLFA